MESCHLVAARRMKLWSLNANLMGPLKQSLVENISLQRCNCNIFGLRDTVGLFAKEAGFFRFGVFFRASSLQNEVGNLPFFYISDITNSSSFNGKICRKKSMFQSFRANVLKKTIKVHTHHLVKVAVMFYSRGLRVFEGKLPGAFVEQQRNITWHI